MYVLATQVDICVPYDATLESLYILATQVYIWVPYDATLESSSFSCIFFAFILLFMVNNHLHFNYYFLVPLVIQNIVLPFVRCTRRFVYHLVSSDWYLFQYVPNFDVYKILLTAFGISILYLHEFSSILCMMVLNNAKYPIERCELTSRLMCEKL